MFTRRAIGLVQRSAAGDEGRETARPEQVDCAGNEIVMQPEPQRTIGTIGANRAIGEGWVANGEIIDWRELGSGKVSCDDARLWLQKPRDARKLPNRREKVTRSRLRSCRKRRCAASHAASSSERGSVTACETSRLTPRCPSSKASARRERGIAAWRVSTQERAKAASSR